MSRSCETPGDVGEASPGESLSCSSWFRRLQDRAQKLPAADRAAALTRLAPQLQADEPLAAAVAALTVADVFPLSWPKRLELARQALQTNTVDEVVTACVAWCEKGRRGVWIAAALRDPTAPQRHAARRRIYVQVGRTNVWQHAGIVQLCEGALRTVDEMLQKPPKRRARNASVAAGSITHTRDVQ